MPFKSQAQRAWMHINHPKMADRWEEHTPDKELPKHVDEAMPKKKFTVPEVWRKIVKWNEPQNGQKFDVLVCNHAVPASDTAYRKFRPCPDCRIAVQKYADEHGTTNEELQMPKTCPSCEEGHHERCRDAWCDCCGTKKESNMVQLPSVTEMFGVEKGSTKCEAPAKERMPKMESVFHIKEAPIQNRPPPGSQPMKPTEYTQMGQRGQALKKGMEALKNSGQEMTPYKTPDGQQIAFPKDAAPGRGPVKADMNTGVWTPMTGSQMGGTGTPFSSQAPTTTMK